MPRKKTFNASSEPIPTIAPLIVPEVTQEHFPTLGSTAPKKIEAASEEERIRQARLEMADLAIARQRERQAKEKLEKESKTESEVSVSQGAEHISGEENTKAMEKALAREKKKKEKEAIALQLKKEEEERIKRKEEKQRDMEEARLLAEKKAKEHEEFLQQKALRDAKKKAAEDAEEEQRQQLVAQRRAEREARKAEKLVQKKAMEEAARQAFEKACVEDVWTQEQQERFETALLDPSVIELTDKYERWTTIASIVGDGKTKSQCLDRYKYIKYYLQELAESGKSIPK